jgi:hypothetical protein
MTRALAFVALLLVAASGPACGKYGKPVRSSPAPSAAVSSGSSSSAQPGTAAPDGEACEEDAQEKTP